MRRRDLMWWREVADDRRKAILKGDDGIEGLQESVQVMEFES